MPSTFYEIDCGDDEPVVMERRDDGDLILEGWDEIPPMRRDFDTKEYSEKTFYPRPGRVTHDTREHMKKKLYPSEAETW